MTDNSGLTVEEKKAIAALKRLAANWPKSLWLYSASGSLCVMQKNKNGERATNRGGGFDADFALATIPIENDGGDW